MKERLLPAIAPSDRAPVAQWIEQDVRSARVASSSLAGCADQNGGCSVCRITSPIQLRFYHANAMRSIGNAVLHTFLRLFEARFLKRFSLKDAFKAASLLEHLWGRTPTCLISRPQTALLRQSHHGEEIRVGVPRIDRVPIPRADGATSPLGPTDRHAWAAARP